MELYHLGIFLLGMLFAFTLIALIAVFRKNHTPDLSDEALIKSSDELLDRHERNRLLRQKETK